MIRCYGNFLVDISPESLGGHSPRLYDTPPEFGGRTMRLYDTSGCFRKEGGKGNGHPTLLDSYTMEDAFFFRMSEVKEFRDNVLRFSVFGTGTHNYIYAIEKKGNSHCLKVVPKEFEWEECGRGVSLLSTNAPPLTLVVYSESNGGPQILRTSLDAPTEYPPLTFQHEDSPWMGGGISSSPDGRFIAYGDTDQGVGNLYLLHIEEEGEERSFACKSHIALSRPSSNAPTYDAFYKTVFNASSSVVAFSSASWGSRGIALYGVPGGEEMWSKQYDDVAGDEDVDEWWGTPVHFCASDTLVVQGIDGIGTVRCWGVSDGEQLSTLTVQCAREIPMPKPVDFAVDDANGVVWFQNEAGDPRSEPYPHDWFSYPEYRWQRRRTWILLRHRMAAIPGDFISPDDDGTGVEDKDLLVGLCYHLAFDAFKCVIAFL